MTQVQALPRPHAAPAPRGAGADKWWVVFMPWFACFFNDSPCDAIQPRARATAAGIMNSVGWAGGAMGPASIGWAAMHGRRASRVEEMSAAIAWGGCLYLIGAGLLFVAVVFCARRELLRSQGTDV